MKGPNLSAKRLAIDKTNATLLVIIATTAFIVIFSIVATRSLFVQLRYQDNVIRKKEATNKQIQENIDEVAKLNTAYEEFASQTTNIIGGNPKGSGDRDGENARIILDALPSKYDFPALTTSLDKLVNSGGFQLAAIDGTDDEVSQSGNDSAVNPEPIEMPFRLEANVNPNDGKRFMELFERSIRPIHVEKLSITGQDSQLKVEVTAKTYYQPEKKLNVTEEVVK